MRERVLITGATGAIGPTLVHHLVAAGYQVTVLSRNVPKVGLLPPDLRHIAGDIRDPAVLQQAIQAVDTVFNLAGMVHIENPDESQLAGYEAVNVQGAVNLAEAARQVGMRRFIQFSSVKVYGTTSAVPLTETAPTNPRTRYAETKLQAEEHLLAIPGLEVTVLRLSAVYGATVKGSWARMVSAIRRGMFLPLGRLESVHSLSYVEDVARAAEFIANAPAANGKIYNLVTHETPTLHQILSAIYGALDKPIPPLHIPMPFVSAAALGLEKGLGLLGKRSPITPTIVEQLNVDEAYSGAGLRSLGFQPQYSLEQGWKRALAASL